MNRIRKRSFAEKIVDLIVNRIEIEDRFPPVLERIGPEMKKQHMRQLFPQAMHIHSFDPESPRAQRRPFRYEACF